MRIDGSETVGQPRTVRLDDVGPLNEVFERIVKPASQWSFQPSLARYLAHNLAHSHDYSAGKDLAVQIESQLIADDYLKREGTTTELRGQGIITEHKFPRLQGPTITRKLARVIRWFLKKVARPRALENYIKATLEKVREEDFVDGNEDSVIAYVISSLRNLRPSVGVSSVMFETPAYDETDLTWQDVHSELQDAEECFNYFARASNRLIQAGVTQNLGSGRLLPDGEEEPLHEWMGTTAEKHHEVSRNMVNYIADLKDKLNELRLNINLWNANLSGKGHDQPMSVMLEHMLDNHCEQPSIIADWSRFDQVREAESIRSSIARKLFYTVFRKQEHIPINLHTG